MGEERDFFISYNKDDKSWAKWIAGTLEENGYTTCIQAWDFSPGNNFVLEMQKALKVCKRSIVVLSQSYLNSDYCLPEWAALFIKDPLGQKKSLIPVRVDEKKPEKVFRSATTFFWQYPRQVVRKSIIYGII